MKKIILSLLPFFLLSHHFSAQLTYVPDNNFEQALIDLGYDNVLDDYVLTANIQNITTLDVSSRLIQDLTGIQDFTSLEILYCNNGYWNNSQTLQTLDLSGMSNLRHVSVMNNRISSVNLTGCSSLMSLHLAGNSPQLTQLDLSHCPDLRILSINWTGITNLDLSNNTNLEEIYTANSNITELDLSQMPNLTKVRVENSIYLTWLNVQNGNNVNISSADFNTTGTSLTCIQVDDPAWSTANWYNVSSNTIFSLDCWSELYTYVPDDNFEQALIDLGHDDVLDDYVLTSNIENLSSINLSGKNISDLTGIEDFISLLILNVSNNNLSTLDVSNLQNLRNLYVQNNNLTGINHANALREVNLSHNPITQFETVNLQQLRRLSIDNTQIASMNLKLNPNLILFSAVNATQLTSLNMRNGNNLAISGNNFNTTGCPNLTCIEVDDPAWSTANWTNIDPQQYFSVNCSAGLTYVPDDNFEQKLIDLGYDSVLDDYVPTANIQNVTSLNLLGLNISDLTGIEDFTSLSVLNCSYNNISSVDLSNNTALTFLSITNNNLTGLDISALTNLTTLYANGNNLSNVNFSANTSISLINLSNNPLAVLDLSTNTQLQYLYVEQTNLLTLDLSMLPGLTRFIAQNNPNLKSINIANGNNQAISGNYFNTTGCPDLNCIEVDDPAWSAANWTNIDPHHTFSTNCSAPMTYVPDDNFEQVLIDQGYDNVLDDYVLTANIQHITGGLPLANKGITDLTGIEDFISLKYLYVNDNQLTSIDVSNLPFLEYLRVQNNQLTSLDISANTKLINVQMSGNNISAIDVSNNPDLVGLYISDNPISSLDLSNNPKLKKLYANQTQIAQIDVSANPLLEEISLQNTPITSLDLSQNPNLLSVKTNNAANLGSLDLRNGNNQSITNTNFNTTGCPALSCIDVDDPAWSAANWTNIDAHQTFSTNCSAPMTYVPDDNFEQALIDLGYDTVLDDYVLTANIQNVTSLNVASKNIADLTGIEDFTALQYLYCFNNQLSSIDLSQNTALRSLSCGQNPLTSIDLTSLVNLQLLYIEQTQINTIDLSQNTMIWDLWLPGNQLTSIDLSQNTAVINLNLSGNQLTNLDLTSNTALQELNLSDNQLSSVVFPQNGSPEFLYLQNNQFTSLDLSQITNLKTLNCSNNQLTELNVKNGNNTILTQFNSTGNPGLTCIEVDDPVWSSANWTNIDAQQFFNLDCNFQSVPDKAIVDVSLFPNPSEGTFRIDSPYPVKEVEIQDVSGKTLWLSSGRKVYNAGHLPRGLYSVIVRTGNEMAVIKWLKQ